MTDRRDPYLGAPAATFEEELDRLGLRNAGFGGSPIGGQSTPKENESQVQKRPPFTPERRIFMLAQFETIKTRAMLAHAKIVSGAYKFSKTQVGCGTNPDGSTQFRDMTDDEKLEQEVGRMKNFLTFMQEHVEAFGEYLSEADDKLGI